MSSTPLSALDPALLGNSRVRLVEAFAARIHGVAAEISEFAEFEAEASHDRDDRRDFAKASRVLLLQRNELRMLVSRALCRHFDLRMDALAGRHATRPATLALVADEQLDEEIVINQCARRLKEQCAMTLWAYTRRLCLLLGCDHLDDTESPVSPQVFARALMEALGGLEAGDAVKKAMFRAYGPVLLDILPEVYAKANAWLGARGIEVDENDYYGAPASGNGRAFAALPTPQEVAAAAVRENASGATLASPVSAGIGVGADAAIDVDERVITGIVSAAFRRLQQDARMPACLHPAVRALQAPTLELALRDPGFLAGTAHPARRFIDLLAEFGLVLELERRDDPRLKSLMDIVAGLAETSDAVPDAFGIAFRRLDDLFYHHEEAQLQGDAVVRALETREALAHAGARVEREIAARLQGFTLPANVSWFIHTVWRDTLVADFMRGGGEGIDWRLGLGTLDELLKSVHPSAMLRDPLAFSAMLPSLVELLKDAAQACAADPARTAAFLTELESLHQAALRGRLPLEDALALRSNAPLPAAAAGPSPSAELAAVGLACGTWLDLQANGAWRRWRLNWISSLRGTVVLKHYEAPAVRIMELDELRAELAAGNAVRVAGLDLARSVLDAATAELMASKRLPFASVVASLPTPCAPHRLH